MTSGRGGVTFPIVLPEYAVGEEGGVGVGGEEICSSCTHLKQPSSVRLQLSEAEPTQDVGLSLVQQHRDEVAQTVKLPAHTDTHAHTHGNENK